MLPTPGEAGLLLTQVLRHQPFLGYRGPRELSEKKLVKNVRRPNDLYYNTGDVLAMDHEGFLYFRDRLDVDMENRLVDMGLGEEGGASPTGGGPNDQEAGPLLSRGGTMESGRSVACGRRRGFSCPGEAGLMTRRWGSVVRRQGPSYPGWSGAGLGRRHVLSFQGGGTYGQETGPIISRGGSLRTYSGQEAALGQRRSLLSRALIPGTRSNPTGGRVRTCPRGRWRACCQSWTSCRR